MKTPATSRGRKSFFDNRLELLDHVFVRRHRFREATPRKSACNSSPSNGLGGVRFPSLKSGGPIEAADGVGAVVDVDERFRR